MYNHDDLQAFDIDDYIPSCGHGTVIITSRRPECIKQGRRGFEVNQMQPSEGIKVLMASAGLRYEDATPDGKSYDNLLILQAKTYKQKTQ